MILLLASSHGDGSPHWEQMFILGAIGLAIGLGLIAFCLWQAYREKKR